MKEFKDVYKHPETNISEVSLMKHYALEQCKKLKRKEDFYLREDDLFGIEVVKLVVPLPLIASF